MFFTVLYYSIFKVSSLLQSIEGIFKGFKSMIYALAIVLMSFVLKEVNDGLGLTNYIIEVVSPVLTKELLPGLAFVSLSLIAFATGSFWGSLCYFISDYSSTCSQFRGQHIIGNRFGDKRRNFWVTCLFLW